MKPKIIWVKHWQNIPEEGMNYGVHAVSFPDDNIVYAIRGKTNNVDLQHEIGHIKLKHGNDNPKSPKKFAKQELEATLYAYNQIGKPSHILEKLRGIYNSLTTYDYKVSPIEAKNILREELYAIDPPETWISDYNKLYGEYKKARKEGRI